MKELFIITGLALLLFYTVRYLIFLFKVKYMKGGLISGKFEFETLLPGEILILNDGRKVEVSVKTLIPIKKD